MAVNESDYFSRKILDFQGNQFPIVHEGSMQLLQGIRGDVCSDLPAFSGDGVQIWDHISW